MGIKKDEFISIDNFDNIFLSVEKRKGILDKNFTQIIEPKYDRLTALNHQFIKASEEFIEILEKTLIFKKENLE